MSPNFAQSLLRNVPEPLTDTLQVCIHIFFDVHRTYKPQEEGACITFLEFVKKVRGLAASCCTCQP